MHGYDRQSGEDYSPETKTKPNKMTIIKQDSNSDLVTLTSYIVQNKYVKPFYL